MSLTRNENEMPKKHVERSANEGDKTKIVYAEVKVREFVLNKGKEAVKVKGKENIEIPNAGSKKLPILVTELDNGVTIKVYGKSANRNTESEKEQEV